MSTSWKVRHAGSPVHVEVPDLQELIRGLQEERWRSDDEVMGPGENEWMPMEVHPQLEEIVLELEPLPDLVEEDDSRLDMNPLIDVALVLLIFFILTTSYTAIQRVLEMPGVTKKDVEGPIRVSKAKISALTIKVTARLENGKPVLKVEDDVVDEADLLPALRRYVRETRKTQILIDAEGVDWGTVVMIQDAAKGAGIEAAAFLTKPKT
jgi:biopolymer transport protein ExbD